MDTQPNQPDYVGPYQLLAPIARGGMAMVFRALDPRAGREVALKVLPAGGSPAAQRRLLREAQALAQLQHPNVVQVHDAGESPRGPYVALELIEGGSSLADRLADRGPFSPRRAVEIAIALADALQACHAAGILHRDVKPANVLLTLDQRPLLTDFGLALQSADDLTRLSKDGAILGTPGFFPPEQALGKLDLIDERSDVYGLGATLYALLTGRPPVEGTTLAEILIATEHKDATPPSDSHPEIHPELDRIVLRCLARDPARRFSSAGETADALRAYTRGEFADPSHRRPLLLGGLALGAVVVGLAIGLPGTPAFDPEPEPPPTPSRSAGPESAPQPLGLLFRPPPVGALARVRCRFEQTLESPKRRQLFLFELVARGEVVRSGDTSRIEGKITRVLGRVKDPAQDLRYDTDRPDLTSGTARLVVGDLLALVGRPLGVNCAHNSAALQLEGLPATAKIAGQSFDPGALAGRRVRAAHGCFPLPAAETQWTRTIPFAIEAAFKLHEGQVRLSCSRKDASGGIDFEFQAGVEDVTWSPTTPRVTGFHLEGKGQIRDGWVSSAQVNVSFKGTLKPAEPYTYDAHTVYSVEVSK